jgi:hypothetical protein
MRFNPPLGGQGGPEYNLINPKREGGKLHYINDLSPSPLGEGFRERQNTRVDI